MVNNNLMTSRTYSGTFPSPETPPSGEEGLNIGIPKGWSSERVPRSSYRNRGQVASAALMPFSSGRTLPSKWEDAERWICSPVSLGNVSTTNTNYSYCDTVASTGPRAISHLTQSQRRAKSKSGPLGPVGPGYYTGGYHNFSPVLGVGVINGAKWRNSLTVESPGMTSARFEERLDVESGGGSEGGRRSCPNHDTTTHWLDSWSGPPSPTQGQEIGEVNLGDENDEAEEEKYEGEGEGGAGVERAVSRRDMATQMYPESEDSAGSRPSSSPKSFMSSTSPHPLLSHEPDPEPEPEPKPKKKVQSTVYEVRDVQVDRQASCTRSRSNANHVREDDYSTGIQAAGNQIFKIQREEAKINAWENLQKAKAESAIQKLEEKLEKKRESTMNRIIQKLRKAEIKADKMRSSISSGSNKTESRAISKTTSKKPSFCIKLRLNSLSRRNCTTCIPF